MIRTRATDATRLTGERPRQEATPGSLLALHDAGYRAVLERLGGGRVLDVGCGEGFETVRLAGAGRTVLGVDYSEGAVRHARARARTGTGAGAGVGTGAGAGAPLAVGCMDACALGIGSGAFDAVCSSHLIEHFSDPERHVAEIARVLSDSGEAYVLTPNAPADFENPFHLHLFGPDDLEELLSRYFVDVWVGGVDASDAIKEEFAARRAKAARLLRLDVCDLRHRMPRRWYLALYTRLLPLAYRVLARGGTAGAGAADWFVTDEVDHTTLVLFAVCRRPRPLCAAGPGGGPA